MICVAASPSVDTWFEVARLSPGRIHRPNRQVRVAGGKALNLARCALSLAGKPLLVALLAEHGGAWIEKQLGADGVPTLVYPVPGEVRRCLSVLDAASGALTEFYEDTQAVDPTDWQAFTDLALDRCEPGRWFVLTGSLPPGVPRDAYARLLSRARARGALTALDASGPVLAAALEAGPDLVKVNEAEACELLGSSAERIPAPAVQETAAAPAARVLRALAGGDDRVAVVTAGDRGAACAGPHDLSLRARPLHSAPHSTGSGDAFLAGLLVGRERGLDWAGSLRLAQAAGTANAERAGAGILDPLRVETLAPLVELER